MSSSRRNFQARISLESFIGDLIPALHFITPRTDVCKYCYALLFKHETQKICCNRGKVKLAEWTSPHTFIKDLFLNDDERSKTFFKNIRAYNSLFSFVSLGVQLDKRLNSQQGPYCFSIQGCLYHRIGSLMPDEGCNPQYAQIYFFDTDFDKQLDQRSAIFQGLDRQVISGIQSALNETHPYIQAMKCAREKWIGTEDLSIKLIYNRSQQDKRYCQPTASEVAVIMNDSLNESHRDIILTTRKNELKKIDKFNSAYDPLAYPLFGGNAGFQLFLPHDDGTRNITIREFYAYRLHHRPSTINFLLHGRWLFNQYIVYQYAKVEQSNLQYARQHQTDFRADVYQGLTDSFMHDFDRDTAGTVTGRNVGHRIILPSTFTGSPRQMHQLFQDSLTIVRYYGKPDIFMTVTCNPNWKEITNELFLGQRPEDRPDIRVFNMKLKEIMKDLLQNAIFGKVIAYMNVIEFQNRDLPHAHILLILDPSNRISTVQHVDEIFSTEIPNPQTQPVLFDSVTKHMMHGPCGSLNPDAPCMKDGICSKGFPKAYCEQTTLSQDAYPTYHRKRHGQSVMKLGIAVGNEWVVPYNPYMTQKYDAHINVEICSGIAAVKYLYKYMYKGFDRATMEVNKNDEIKQYIDGRYLFASEGCWHLFCFKLHSRSHAVYRLPVHLPNQQYIHFADTDHIAQVLEEGKDTMLTQFFKLSQQDVFAKTLLYPDIPVYYHWSKELKMWFRREHCIQKTLGHMYTAHPSENERFYLRVLLCHVHGPTSYEFLRTYEYQTYPTFKEAVVARGLLMHDIEWNTTLMEASLNCFPHQI